MHSIVILDGYCLNPGDLSWEALESLGTVTVYDRTAPDEIISRAQGATILLTNKTVLSAETIQKLPALQFISVLATGYNIVDTQAAGSQGILLSNVPAYSTDSVAQLTWALLLELTHQVGLHASSVRRGDWSSSLDFSYQKSPLMELSGLTLGIIGLGVIGQKVAQIAHAFGMQIQSIERAKKPSLSYPVSYTDLETLLKTSDVLSLHAPLNAETDKIINAKTLTWMKPTSFILNTSRGGLIDSEALAQALENKVIAGAALDVLDQEPPPSTHPLPPSPRCLITPHIAWATFAARQRLLDQTIQNVKSFIEGHPINIVG